MPNHIQLRFINEQLLDFFLSEGPCISLPPDGYPPASAEPGPPDTDGPGWLFSAYRYQPGVPINEELWLRDGTIVDTDGRRPGNPHAHPEPATFHAA